MGGALAARPPWLGVHPSLSLAACFLALALLMPGAGTTPLQCPSSLSIQAAGDWQEGFGTKQRIAGHHRYPLCRAGEDLPCAGLGRSFSGDLRGKAGGPDRWSLPALPLPQAAQGRPSRTHCRAQ